MWRVVIPVLYITGCAILIEITARREKRKQREFEKRLDEWLNASLEQRVREANRQSAIETRARLRKMFSLPPED